MLDLPPLGPLPPAPCINTGVITLEELQKCARATPTGKSAGPDDLPSDIVGIMPLLSCLLPIMNDILAGGDPPEVWRRSIIVAIPKKGNSTLLTNQRGLSLMSVNAKLFNRVLLVRLRERLEELMLPWQAGFRPERNTVEQIACLRMVIDTCRARKRCVVITCIVFSKVFDCVDRKALCAILAFYGASTPIIDAIMSLYTSSPRGHISSISVCDRYGLHPTDIPIFRRIFI